MVKLKNIPGLGALHGKPADSAPQHSNSSGTVMIIDLGLMDKINLRTSLDNAVVRAALKHAVGTDLPEAYNTVNVAGDRSIIWLGPDEWMIISENGANDEIIAAVDTPEAGHVAVVEVSDALGILAISGAHARDVLAKHCAIDFHPSAFKKNMAAQSFMSHAGVTITCTGDDSFMVIGRTSFMPYLLDLIKDASLEYGFDYKPAA